MTQQVEQGFGRARGLVDRAPATLDTSVAPRTLRPAWERRYAGLMPLGDLAVTVLVALACGALPWVDAKVALILAFSWLVPLAVGGAYETVAEASSSNPFSRSMMPALRAAPVFAFCMTVTFSGSTGMG